MRIIIVILTILTIYAQAVLSQSNQIDSYSNLLNNSHLESETLWASTILYSSLSDINKPLFANELENEYLRDVLISHSTVEANLHLSKYYKDEHLLLAYLLNESVPAARKSAFSTFYDEFDPENTLLKNLNYHITHEIKLSHDFYNIKHQAFTLFLLDNYRSTIQIIDENFYEYVIDQRKRILIEENISGLKRELYLAAYFNALYSLNRFNEINNIYNDLLNFSLFPISYEKRNLYWALDYVMYSLGYLNKSLMIQREYSLPLSEFLGDESGHQAIYSSHGSYLYILGKYREAGEVFESTLKRSDQLNDHHLTLLYHNLSLIYFKTGESTRYTDTQLRALEHAQSSDNYDDQISIYRSLHIFYRKNQNFDLSLQYLNKAAELAETHGRTSDLASIYISRAVFEKNYSSDNTTPLLFLEKAQNFVDENTPARTLTRILSEKASIHKSNNYYIKSFSLQNEILNIGKSQNDPSIFLEALVEIAALELIQGNFYKATNLLRDFRSHDISVVDFRVLTLSRLLQAQLHHHNDEFIKAEELFAETTEIVLERARYSADHETGYWTVEQEYMMLFEAYADFLIDQNQYEDAVQLLDRVKTINDTSMLQNPLISSTQLSEEQLTRNREITREMETLRRQLFIASGAERLQLNNQLERLQAQKRELFQYQNSMVAERNEIPIWSIRRTLGRDQMLFHVTSINDSYYISRITRNKTEIQKFEIDQERKNIFEAAIEGIISGRTDLGKLYQVGRMFDIQSIAESYSSLILLPDGYLHQLPLAVIPLSEPATKYSYGATTFLIEKMDVRTLNRLTDIREKRQNREFEYDFTGFGVADFQNTITERSLMPLPQAPGEVNSVSDHLQRFPKRASFIESEATPQRFKEIAGKSRILHMATHSEISESDPLFSRLHLMPDQDGDDPVNQIFAYELFELDLQNELIMLNSCESGGDRAIQGSGIMGLSRALNYAGANSLVLNAWSVNDQFAADFAEVFYQHINNGETKSRALQLTKIDFIKNKNANPHFWGSYILNGNNQPLIQKQALTLGNWLIALIFIAGFIVVARTRQQVV